MDPFGSGAFSSGEGFADFSQMSKVKVTRKATVLLKMYVQILFFKDVRRLYRFN